MSADVVKVDHARVTMRPDSRAALPRLAAGQNSREDTGGMAVKARVCDKLAVYVKYRFNPHPKPLPQGRRRRYALSPVKGGIMPPLSLKEALCPLPRWERAG